MVPPMAREGWRRRRETRPERTVMTALPVPSERDPAEMAGVVVPPSSYGARAVTNRVSMIAPSSTGLVIIPAWVAMVFTSARVSR
jgi:hypothetical protein